MASSVLGRRHEARRAAPGNAAVNSSSPMRSRMPVSRTCSSVSQGGAAGCRPRRSGTPPRSSRSPWPGGDRGSSPERGRPGEPVHRPRCREPPRHRMAPPVRTRLCARPVVPRVQLPSPEPEPRFPAQGPGALPLPLRRPEALSLHRVTATRARFALDLSEITRLEPGSMMTP